MQIAGIGAGRRVLRALLVAGLAVPVLSVVPQPAGASYATGWTARTLPVGVTSQRYSTFKAVACASATFCVAAGSYSAPGATGQLGLIDVLRNGSWVPYNAPGPTGSTRVSVTAVSCVLGALCWFAGSATLSTGTYGIVDTLYPTRVHISTVPDPPGSGTASNQDVEISGLSCPATGSCVAVGQYNDSAGRHHAFTSHLSSGTWTSTDAPVPSDHVTGTTRSYLLDVSCLSTTTCIAGGSYTGKTGTTTSERDLIDLWRTGTWSADTASPPHGGRAFVACPTASRCFGVSGSTIATYNGSSWSTVAVPTPPGAPAGKLDVHTIVCPSPTRCVAMGSVLTSNRLDGELTPGLAMVATWNGSSWASVDVTPADAGEHIDGLGCASATTCVGVGSERDSGGIFIHPLIVTWHAGTTTAIEGPETRFTPPDTPGGGNTTGGIASLTAVACADPTHCVAAGKWLLHTNEFQEDTGPEHGFLDTFAAPTPSGYDMVGADGGVFVFNPPGHTGGFYGSLPKLGISVSDIVGMTPTASDKGYYLVGADGGVFAFGTAPYLGSLPGIGETPAQPIVGIVPTGTNGGYFLVGRDGGVFTFGNATYLGSVPGLGVARDDIIGITATPSGSGYWVIAADGTVYAFGLALTFGPATGTSSPVAAIAGTPDGTGYWVATRNGGVQAFGDANSFGSLPALGVTPALPVIDIVRTSNTGGYWLIGADGGIFAFGDAGFSGSLPTLGIAVSDVVGAVPTG